MRFLFVLLALTGLLSAPAKLQAQSCPTGGVFATEVQYASGAYALAVVSHDFNGDEIPDLAVANYGEGTVSILRGRGDGTFGAKVAVASGAGPRNLALADFNHDGIMDLAVTNLTVNAVTILIGQGTGSTGNGDFVAGPSFVVLQPRGVAVGDFNEDAIHDLLITGSQGVSVLLGTGTGGAWSGGFQLVGPYAAVNPWAAASADFNGDGIQDIAVANKSAAYVSIHLGQGTGGVGNGTFAPGTDVALPFGQEDIVALDLNADGIVDLALPNGNLVAVLVGQGSGGIGNGQFALTTFSSGPSHNGIVAGDFDGDGRPDLAVTDPGLRRVLLFRGTTAGALAAPEAYGVGEGAVGLTTADFDRDAALDLAVANSGGQGSVSILLGRCPTQLPWIGNVQPRAGQPGDPVRILGTNLAAATAVLFDGVPATILAAMWDRIDTVVPPGATTGPITVVTPGGTVTTTFDFLVGFRPEIAGATPVRGKVGTTVVLAGNHLTGVTRVAFGPASNAAFTVDSDVQITAVVDADAVTGPVSVSNPIGTAVTPFDFEVLPYEPRPRIVDVRDVPNDQGGRVVVRWLPSDLDIPEFASVVGYRVWRRAPLDLGARADRVPSTWRREVASSGEVVFWEPLATMPSGYLTGYAYTAPTTQDSMKDSNPFTAFFVQTLTTDPFVFHSSEVDSGYSKDDLSPHKPSHLDAAYGEGGVALSWGGSDEPDFAEYHLYRGGSFDFVPGAGTLIYAGTDTALVDAAPGACYKLSAVDVHGNESLHALATPSGSTTSVAFAVTVHAQPTQVAIDWYVIGLPGAVVHVYRREEGGPWSETSTLMADAGGMVRYRDATVRSGQRLRYRLGTLDGDVEVFSDDVRVTVPEAKLAFGGFSPNPIGRHREASVAFTLPQAGPVTLRLYDASGRVALTRDLGWKPAGAHRERLRLGGSLPAGMYWIRVGQGASAVGMKICVLGQ